MNNRGVNPVHKKPAPSTSIQSGAISERFLKIFFDVVAWSQKRRATRASLFTAMAADANVSVQSSGPFVLNHQITIQAVYSTGNRIILFDFEGVT
jgi:hypothetical protein